MTRPGVKRLAEHRMGESDAEKGAEHLRDDVGTGAGPAQPALPRVRERDGWIEVGTRDRSERENEGDEGGSRRNRIRKQCNGDVAAGQSFAHDARADDGGEEKRRADEFRDRRA